ncbi:MAG: hypothetical protein HYX50_02965 [Chloroflexi bacterium]|nr:hypothetical protein [Chloroflexota bacterium]
MAIGVLVTLGSFLLAVVFLTSSVWKLRNSSLFGHSLSAYLTFSHPLLVWLFVVIEFTIGAALFAGIQLRFSASLASVLLLGFTAGTARLVVLRREPTCGCGGVLGSTRVSFGMIGRNSVLAAGAGWVAWYSSTSAASLQDFLGQPKSIQALSWAVLALVCGSLVLVYGMQVETKREPRSTA